MSQFSAFWRLASPHKAFTQIPSMPATVNPIKVSALGFCQIDASGKIVELEVQMNFFVLMEQLKGTAA